MLIFFHAREFFLVAFVISRYNLSLLTLKNIVYEII